MPDHPSSFIPTDYATFLDIVRWCDVVFLLVDTREARWVPTLVSAAMGKLCVNAAVGFDSFVVMRHGVRGMEGMEGRLGCYFCSDIMSPQNVRTLTLQSPQSLNWFLLRVCRMFSRVCAMVFEFLADINR